MSIVSFSQQTLSKMDEDPFIEMAKYIYSKYGFGHLNKYYTFMCNIKREIVSIFLKLTTYIQNNDNQNIESSFLDFVKIKTRIMEKIIEIDADCFNPIFINIQEHFNKIKLNDLLYTENDSLIISKTHMEWLARSRNLTSYYNKIDEEQFTQIKPKKKFGFLGWLTKSSNSLPNKLSIEYHQEKDDICNLDDDYEEEYEYEEEYNGEYLHDLYESEDSVEYVNENDFSDCQLECNSYYNTDGILEYKDIYCINKNKIINSSIIHV